MLLNVLKNGPNNKYSQEGTLKLDLKNGDVRQVC